MRISDIASRNNWNASDLEAFIVSNTSYHVETKVIGSNHVNESDVDSIVNQYQDYLANKAKIQAEKKAKAEQFRKEKEKAMSEMLITSGFNFDGYTITKYSGYISGDDAVQVDRGGSFWSSSNIGDKLLESMVKIRRVAIQELKEQAFALGCNAVIGVDFDYLTMDPETVSMGNVVLQPYVFCVTANGNAVIIEKNE